MKTSPVQVIACAALVAGLLASPALAHFQVVYLEDPVRDPGQAADVALVFTHPFHAAPNMEMGVPESFSLIHQRGEAEPTGLDLKEFLEPVTWSGPENSVPAYRARIPGSAMRSFGDYTFVLRPSPFYEATEDKYIQQFTKLVTNVGGVPGNWDQPLGLPVEIVPLDKPYANWAGGVFRGIVMSEGEPVPFAEIEVEYMNRDLDLEANRWVGGPKVEAPFSALENLSLRADANGTFAIGLPRAGWWGIGALDAGPDKEHEGKALSQDAVIWVQATDMLAPAADGQDQAADAP